jgi:hypothetical protein
VVAEHLDDLSELLRSVGSRQQAFPVPHGRGDGVTRQNGPEPRQAGKDQNALGGMPSIPTCPAS